MAKKLFIVAILAAVIAGGLFLVFSQQQKEITFAQGFNELKQVWEKYGIQMDGQTNEFEKISALSGQQITSVKNDFKKTIAGLEAFPDSTQKQSIIDLITVYAGLVEITAKDNEITVQDGKISQINPLEGCNYISLFKNRNSARRESVELSKKFTADVENFISKYPVENRLAGFNAIDFDFSTIEEDLQVKENSVLSLEEDCR